MRRVAMLLVAGVLGLSCVAAASPRAPAGSAPPASLSAVPAWQPLPPWATALITQLSFGWGHPHAMTVPVPGPPSASPPVPRLRGYTCFIAQSGDPCGRPAHPLPIVLP